MQTLHHVHSDGIGHVASVIWHPSSDIRHLASVIWHPSSDIRHLASASMHQTLHHALLVLAKLMHRPFRPCAPTVCCAHEQTLDQCRWLVLTGTWFAGVEGDDHSDCKYTITINKFECPLNCSGRGTCVHASNGTRSCDCQQLSPTLLLLFPGTLASLVMLLCLDRTCRQPLRHM